MILAVSPDRPDSQLEPVLRGKTSKIDIRLTRFDPAMNQLASLFTVNASAERASRATARQSD